MHTLIKPGDLNKNTSADHLSHFTLILKKVDILFDH